MSSYIIHRDPHYYQGSLNGERPGALHDSDAQHITLASATDAEKLCTMLNDKPAGYVLSHNQYATPSHEVRESVLPARYTLSQAMRVLALHYDFGEDGHRLPASIGTRG